MRKNYFGINNKLWKLNVTIIVLFCFFALPLIAADNEQKPTQPQSNTTQAIKYPPYPDVWDWQVPNLETYVRGSLRTYLLDNGDVIIMYSLSKKPL
jgi:hypothetical protein